MSNKRLSRVSPYPSWECLIGNDASCLYQASDMCVSLCCCPNLALVLALKSITRKSEAGG
jgi:hypothetical protein